MDWLTEIMDEGGERVSKFLAVTNCPWCHGTGWDKVDMLDMDGGYTIDVPCGCICKRIAYVEYFERPKTEQSYSGDIPF